MPDRRRRSGHAELSAAQPTGVDEELLSRAATSDAYLEKGRVPMTIPARPLDRKRLWLVSVVSIVAILAVNYIVSGPAHVGSPIVVRLAAAAIVTVFVAVANLVAGPRAAAVTAVVGVAVAVVVLSQSA